MPPLPPTTLHTLMWTIFSLTYLGLALGRFPRLVLDRPAIALVGGIAMLLSGALTLPQALSHIDVETLLLLFGLMTFSAQLRQAGFYDTVAEHLTHLAARPHLLLALLIATAALLSALLANDIVCLAFTPLLCTGLLAARRDPTPYLLALATSSNIGSAATLIGNPQNMYIGSTAQLPFAHFTLTLLPPTLLSLLLCYLTVALLFRKSLSTTSSQLGTRNSELGTPAPPIELHPFLIAKTLVLLIALVTFFLLSHSPQHRAIAALAGAALLLISTRAKAAKLYLHVDYSLILLFLGLFVVNGAMQQQHLTDELFSTIAHHNVNLSHLPTLAAVTTILSNLVSNVPAVLLLQPSVAATAASQHSHTPWYLLALVSTWAGNLTLVGSIANLIVAEGAAAHGVRLPLPTYCKVGIPLTILTVLLGTVWLIWLA